MSSKTLSSVHRCVPMLMRPKGRNGNSHKWVAIPTANTIMAQAKDYTNKIQFWTEQLALAGNPLTAHKTRYTLSRCQDSLAYFTQRQRALEQMRAGDLLELPNMTEEQHDRLAVASVAVSNLITEFAGSDPRWNAIWEEFDLLEAIEDHIKKLQS